MKKEKKPKLYPSQKGMANTVGMFSTDPMGMYTGRPSEEFEEPVQDADDL